MAAILATALVHLRSGDHVVCSNAVFGATIQLFNAILARFGIETTYVSPTRADEWVVLGAHRDAPAPAPIPGLTGAWPLSARPSTR